MAKINANDQDFLEHHLRYEFEMLQGTYLMLQNDGHDAIIANALIESFCIHARQLIEFFSNRQGRRAKEFTGGTYAAAYLGALGDTETKLNTQIAHLTGLRTTDGAKKIGEADRQKLLAALEQEAQNFAGHLASSLQGMFIPPMPITVTLANGPPTATNQIVTI